MKYCKEFAAERDGHQKTVAAMQAVTEDLRVQLSVHSRVRDTTSISSHQIDFSMAGQLHCCP